MLLRCGLLLLGHDATAHILRAAGSAMAALTGPATVNAKHMRSESRFDYCRIRLRSLPTLAMFGSGEFCLMTGLDRVLLQNTKGPRGRFPACIAAVAMFAPVIAAEFTSPISDSTPHP